MARPQKFHCCPFCGERIEPVTSIGEKVAAIVRALGTGPKPLGTLAIGVYGQDSARTRRKVSALINRALRPDVESDGKGTWRLVQRAEAAE